MSQILASRLCRHSLPTLAQWSNSSRSLSTSLSLKQNQDDNKPTGFMAKYFGPESSIASPDFKNRWGMFVPAFATHICLGAPYGNLNWIDELKSPKNLKLSCLCRLVRHFSQFVQGVWLCRLILGRLDSGLVHLSNVNNGKSHTQGSKLLFFLVSKSFIFWRLQLEDLAQLCLENGPWK